MPSDPDNRKIEELLKAYGKKRQQDLGAPVELHPATRKMLQGEVARLHPAPAKKPGFFKLALRYWPRLAIAGGTVALLTLTLVNINRHPNPSEELTLNQSASQKTPAKKVAESDHYSKQDRGLREELVREKSELSRTPPDNQLRGEPESEVRLRRAPAQPQRDFELADGLAKGIDPSRSLDRAKRSLAEAPPSSDSDALSSRDAARAGGAPGDTRLRLAVEPPPAAVNKPGAPFSDLKDEGYKSLAQNEAGARRAAPYGFGEAELNAKLAGGAAPQPSPAAPAIVPPAATAPTLAYDAPVAIAPKNTMGRPNSDAFAAKKSAAAATAPVALGVDQASGAAPYSYYFGSASQGATVRFQNIKATTRSFRGFAKSPQAAVGPLSSTFEFQQRGQVVQIVDSDGSVYDGRLLTVAANDLADQAKDSIKLQVPAEQPAKEVVDQQAQPAIKFTASGTNRTLQKLVIITAAVIPDNQATNSNFGFEPKATEGIGGLASAVEQKKTAATLPAGISLRPAKIQGTLRIDKTNEFRLDATNITR